MNTQGSSGGAGGGVALRLLSYNVQVGIAAKGFRDYLLSGWKHILPSSRRLDNLHRIARMISGFDIVGLQEIDGGSLRSGYINHADYLAREAGFPHWFDKTNRKLWKVARHSMGILSRYAPNRIESHVLPARLPGRGALAVSFGNPEDPLVLIMAHLSLGRKARRDQMEYLSAIMSGYDNVILMGDLNCSAQSREMSRFLSQTGLCMPYSDLQTYPSWNPRRHLDHILVSPGIRVHEVKVLKCPFSDHLPMTMEVTVPRNVLMCPGREWLNEAAA
ncbi:MAG: endonuclease/exonuclease/phosphatase family protein [Desulfomonilia bacterium]|jgi:endonuclease/exonuclease/phosphatase family metal-dependent hydrolase